MSVKCLTITCTGSQVFPLFLLYKALASRNKTNTIILKNWRWVHPIDETIMAKDIEKYPVELDDYECNLIVNNAMIFGTLKATLTRLSKKEGTHITFKCQWMK